MDLVNQLIDIAREGGKRAMPKPLIEFSYQYTPALWFACREGWEPGEPGGYGATKAEAVSELLREEQDREP